MVVQKKNLKEILSIILLVIISCISISIIETIIEPSYAIKSGLKICLFLFIPMLVMKILKINIFDNFKLDKKNIFKLLILGIIIFTAVMLGYIFTKGIFNYETLVESLKEDQQVNSSDFLLIAIYISLCNSFIEEFLFRLIAFINLSKYVNKRIAYIFSSVIFALYHIGMIGKSFPLPLLIISLFGLAIGGFIFDYVDDKNKNIYNSWFIHMFADIAIMVIWFIYI